MFLIGKLKPFWPLLASGCTLLGSYAGALTYLDNHNEALYATKQEMASTATKVEDLKDEVEGLRDQNLVIIAKLNQIIGGLQRASDDTGSSPTRRVRPPLR